MRLIDADALIKQKEEYIRLLETKINSEINVTEKKMLVHRVIRTLDMIEIIRTAPTVVTLTEKRKYETSNS